MRKVIVNIAVSLDGYIAHEDGNIDWLSMVEVPGEDYGYATFYDTIDTVVMGRKTYEKLLSFGIPYPHSQKQSYIISKTLSGSKNQSIVFFNGDVKTLVTDLKQLDGKDIFIDGGAQLVQSLLKEKLIDNIVISTIPVLLGGGIRLFNGELPFQKLQLLRTKSFDSGLVQFHYTLV
ncbi:dihydrofolate reductase [Bacteroidetes bacterium UKL13-3]|jgi:dihydrofolate reductase|nr:dihydrofolate reductase [Bacteroidetes bacterium UKL13-3]HCP93891.1 dihydrofolate reductase [Bacteroidota bacterium]